MQHRSHAPISARPAHHAQRRNAARCSPVAQIAALAQPSRCTRPMRARLCYAPRDPARARSRRATMCWLLALLRLAPAAPRAPRATLLALPDDVLLAVIRRTPRPAALALTCRRLLALFHASLRTLTLAARVEHAALARLFARAAPAVRRVVLRACPAVDDAAVALVAERLVHVRDVDLSFVPAVTDAAIVALCARAHPRLRVLLVRKCHRLTDRALEAVAACTALHTLDISYLPHITDAGVGALFQSRARARPELRLLALSHCPALTDVSFRIIGESCPRLSQICARALPLVTDVGFLALCRGVGRSVEGIDVLDCTSLTRDSVLAALRDHCPQVYANVMCNFAGKALRQIIISTLRRNIFVVHGSDPASRRATVHTLIIDNGDVRSASLLSSGTTDLSLLGVVLCKSYGSALDSDAKTMLADCYGIPTCALAE